MRGVRFAARDDAQSVPLDMIQAIGGPPGMMGGIQQVSNCGPGGRPPGGPMGPSGPSMGPPGAVAAVGALTGPMPRASSEADGNSLCLSAKHEDCLVRSDRGR